GGDLHRLVLGDDHGGGAGGGGAAQAGTEVVRVLHAVQHQHQGLAVGVLHQSGQVLLVPGPGGHVAGGDALVAQAAGDAVQRLLGDPAHVDVLAPGLGFEVGDAR